MRFPVDVFLDRKPDREDRDGPWAVTQWIILSRARPMFKGTKLRGSKWWSSLLYTHCVSILGVKWLDKGGTMHTGGGGEW